MAPVLFFACAAIALTGAFGVVLARNPVHSALFLVMTMVTMAAFFLGLQAPLVAIVQIIVYASAIVVLFLFVIMLLGVDRHETLADGRRYQRPAALVLGVATFVVLLVLTLHDWQLGPKTVSGTSITDAGGSQVKPLASTLFTRFAWPFEATAVLLVIAVVGSVVLARRSRRPSADEGARA
jgi:NADH-quinone oxidoreductase subunit J